MIRKIILSLILVVYCRDIHVSAQFHSSSDVLLEMERLKSPYRVLYLAAHPDDENTRLISYLTAKENASTAYLSLTRGDGGQNLIGDEKGVLLGVLRTEELMAARRLDHAGQFFSRAVDFGYSKTSDETFQKWGKDVILGDVVHVIRHFKPHVIINRFPPQNYAGHGHHQASAILSAEAFDLAEDLENMPATVPGEEAWNPGALYMNTSTWWDKTLPERAKNDQNILQVDIGSYNALTGYSYSELAAVSRSQHKSQGFGSAPSRGSQMEYLEFLKGNPSTTTLLRAEMLDETDRNWLKLQPEMDSLIKSFDIQDPSKSVNDLLALRKKVDSLQSATGRFQKKLEQLDRIILYCTGLVVELISDEPRYCGGETIHGTLRVINRSGFSIQVNDLKMSGTDLSWNRPLETNVVFEDSIRFALPDNAPLSNPYWLDNPYNNVFNHDRAELDVPDNHNDLLRAQIGIQIDGQVLHIPRYLTYQWTDRVKGGLERETQIVPPATVRFDRPLYFANDGKAEGKIVVTSNRSGLPDAQILFDCDSNLFVEVAANTVMPGKGEKLVIPFRISVKEHPPADNHFHVSLICGNDTLKFLEDKIEYDHIHPQSVFLPNDAALVSLGQEKFTGKVAYVEGPDNEMIPFLANAGVNVSTFTEEDMIQGKLKNYDVLLFGIRSLNIHPVWNHYVEQIEAFMKKGGLVVVLYQTNRDVEVAFKPYPFEISRNRVTNEDAVPHLLLPEHEVLNHPFKMGSADFGGWNQERGLYFAEKWDEHYKPVISWFDEGEEADSGALIVGDYGKGAFIYTGISFFRHLPEGVPGSYKLLINILSYHYKPDVKKP